MAGRRFDGAPTPGDAGVGDLIFCRPNPQGGRLAYAAERLVAQATGGPYCHVRVRIGPGLVVEALPWLGITRTPLLDAPAAADVAPISARLTPLGRAHGVSWLLMQANTHAGYSLGDILADGVQAFVPRWLGARTPFLVAPRQYDCSELATRFLLHAGYYALPDALVDCPQRVSPNDLARALGLCK